MMTGLPQPIAAGVALRKKPSVVCILLPNYGGLLAHIKIRMQEWFATFLRTTYWCNLHSGWGIAYAVALALAVNSTLSHPFPKTWCRTMLAIIVATMPVKPLLIIMTRPITL